MSVEAMAWVLKHERTTKGAERLILLGIANHADDEGRNAWPSVATLAGYANVSARYVSEALGKLEERGLISRTVNGSPDSRKKAHERTNYYEIVAMRDPLNPASPPEPCFTPPPEPYFRDPLNPASDEPSFNHPSEPSATPDGFASFWQAYPARDGRKVGKAKSEGYWRKLSDADRCAALAGAKVYAAERGGKGQVSPKDPERWLRDRCWVDFQPKGSAKPDGMGEGAINEMFRQIDDKLNDRMLRTYTPEQRDELRARCIAELEMTPEEFYRPNVGVIQ